MELKHKYGSPEDVAQRIHEWICENGQEDATTLLLYESMQALKKCHASAAMGQVPEAELRAEFERQHKGRNLKQHRLRGTYVSAPIAALWNQHKRTATWMQSRTMASPERIVASTDDPMARLENPMTPYGMLVRAMRIVVDTTMHQMAKSLGRSPAYLSAIEYGREPVTDDIVADTARFFAQCGVEGLLRAMTVAQRASKEAK